MKVIVHVDGGARGNPGPAAAACVITSPAGEVLGEHAQLLGTATNNVAEYRALLLGLEQARELGASEVEVIGDSELIAKQVQGIYKVKHEAMKPLHREALAALEGLRALVDPHRAPRAERARRRARQRRAGPGARGGLELSAPAAERALSAAAGRIWRSRASARSRVPRAACS